MGKEQNDVAAGFFKDSDLHKREEAVVQEASALTGFKPDHLLGRSAWWGSDKIGAFHYAGTFEDKEAVLKVQGVRPATSEITMIENFAVANKSTVIRPPHLYASVPWTDEKQYEALVMENVGGKPIISTPTTLEEIAEFYRMYQEYRANCLAAPWLEKPTEPLSQKVQTSFANWRKASREIYPDHPLRASADDALIDQTVAVLARGYAGVEPEFMHGHFGANDLYRVGDQVVLLSNLYWSWRQPFYDAIFGYHWHMYHLASVNGITPEAIEDQRTLWLDHIEPLAQGNDQRKLLNLALLERAAAGLNLDALSVDPNNQVAPYLVDATRKSVEQLLEEVAA